MQDTATIDFDALDAMFDDGMEYALAAHDRSDAEEWPSAPGWSSEGFVIDSLDLASWASRRIDTAEEMKLEQTEWRAREIARIEHAFTRNVARHADTIAFLTSSLEVWHRARYALDKKKTIDLPGGRLQIRKSVQTIQILDEVAAIAALKADEATRPIVRVEESIIMSALKAALAQGEAVLGEEGAESETPGMVAHLTTTGERVDWAIWTPPGDSVKFASASAKAAKSSAKTAKKAAKSAGADDEEA